MALPLHARTHPTLDVEGCEGCKFAGISLGFHRCPGGKAEWHGATIKERQTRMLADAKRMGSNVEPVHSSANVWAPTKVVPTAVPTSV